MRKRISLTTIAVVALLLASSCGSSDSSYESKAVGNYTPLKVYRLYEQIYECSKNGSQESLSNDSITMRGVSAVNSMLNIGHPDDSALIKYINSDVVKIFTPEVEKIFDNYDDLENLLGGVAENMKKELPSINMCDIYAIVSSDRQRSIYVIDSTTMLISMNHYLGSQHDAYKGFYEYVKQVKTPKHIPYDIVEAIIGTSPFQFEQNGSETVLNRMLYQGTLIEAKMRLIPGASLALALGYTDDQLKWLEENEQKAWETIVAQKLLYSTNPSDVEKLMLPSPATTIINANAPGRAGRYFGYKIVKAYIEKNPDITLSQLLSPEFYNNQQSFISSGYQGK